MFTKLQSLQLCVMLCASINIISTGSFKKPHTPHFPMNPNYEGSSRSGVHDLIHDRPPKHLQQFTDQLKTYTKYYKKVSAQQNKKTS